MLIDFCEDALIARPCCPQNLFRSQLFSLEKIINFTLQVNCSRAKKYTFKSFQEWNCGFKSQMKSLYSDIATLLL